MIYLNLSDNATSDIKYSISKFPDGQQDVVLDVTGANLSGTTTAGTSWALGVTISSRFNSFKDLELIICAVKALRRLGVKEIHLYVPYMLGARSDRKFQKGGTSYLVDVVAPILNSLNFESVKAIDAHSDICEAVINNFVGETNVSLVRWGLRQLGILGDESVVLVSPDAGALKKIYNVAKDINYQGPVVIGSKHRDVISGKILSTNVDLGDLNLAEKRHFVIVDDICDGGRTFIELAKVIKDKYTGYSDSKVSLIVTHGIFSAGINVLYTELDNVVTTNSVKNVLPLEKEAKDFFQMSVI